MSGYSGGSIYKYPWISSGVRKDLRISRGVRLFKKGIYSRQEVRIFFSKSPITFTFDSLSIIVQLFMLVIYEFTHVMMNEELSSRRCRQSGQTRRKTYGPGETRTHDHAFRGHLLYHWATGPYWTSRLSCHMVELEVSSRLFHYCQLRVIQLVPLVCWRPPTTTPTEMWIFQG